MRAQGRAGRSGREETGVSAGPIIITQTGTRFSVSSPAFWCVWWHVAARCLFIRHTRSRRNWCPRETDECGPPTCAYLSKHCYAYEYDTITRLLLYPSVVKLQCQIKGNNLCMNKMETLIFTGHLVNCVIFGDDWYNIYYFFQCEVDKSSSYWSYRTHAFRTEGRNLPAV